MGYHPFRILWIYSKVYAIVVLYPFVNLSEEGISMFRVRSILALVILLVVASLALTGCAAAPAQAPASESGAAETTAAPVGQDTAEPETPAAGGELTIGLAVEPVSLDPAAGLYLHEHLILMNLYDTLLRADQEGGLHPGLATAWEQSDDGTEFTFTLRDDVSFHDGTQFNAEAVRANFDRIGEGDFGYATAPTILSGYVETEVIDDNTVKVVFEIPKPTFLSDLSRYWMAIPSPTAVQEQADAFGQNPVGTGPFVFDEWAAQDHITLVKNPDYNLAPEFAAHDGPALLETITFRFLPEAADPPDGLADRRDPGGGRATGIGGATNGGFR